MIHLCRIGIKPLPTLCSYGHGVNVVNKHSHVNVKTHTYPFLFLFVPSISLVCWMEHFSHVLDVDLDFVQTKILKYMV